MSYSLILPPLFIPFSLHLYNFFFIFFLSLLFSSSGEATYKSTPKEVDKEYIYLEGLDPNYNYEVRVVSVDGEHQTPSRVKPISLSDEVPCKKN